MLFSILIPVKNNDKTIAESIQSCLNQNFEDEYEIIVSNNYSTDNTKSIINSFNKLISISFWVYRPSSTNNSYIIFFYFMSSYF